MASNILRQRRIILKSLPSHLLSRSPQWMHSIPSFHTQMHRESFRMFADFKTIGQRRSFFGVSSTSFRFYYTEFNARKDEVLKYKPGLIYIILFFIFATSYAFICALPLFPWFESMTTERNEENGESKTSYLKWAILPINPLFLYRIVNNKQKLKEMVEIAGSGIVDDSEKLGEIAACNALLNSICVNREWCAIVLRDTNLLPQLLNHLRSLSFKENDKDEKQEKILTLYIPLIRLMSRVETSHEQLIENVDLFPKIALFKDKKVNACIAEIVVNLLCSQICKTQKCTTNVKDNLLKCSFILTFSKNDKTKYLAYLACDMLIQDKLGNESQVEELRSIASKYLRDWMSSTVLSNWIQNVAVSFLVPLLFLSVKGINLKVQGLVRGFPFGALMRHGTKSALVAVAYTTLLNSYEYALRTSFLSGPIFSKDDRSKQAKYLQLFYIAVLLSNLFLIGPIYMYGLSGVLTSCVLSLMMRRTEPFPLILDLLSKRNIKEELKERQERIENTLEVSKV
jgi:hypothetical protein